MQSFLQKNTALYLFVALLGGSIGAFIVTYCQDGSCLAMGVPTGFDLHLNMQMLAQPVYFVWLIFIVFLTAISFLMAAPLWASLRFFRPYLTKKRVTDLVVSTFLLLVILMFPDGILGLLARAGMPLPVYLFYPRILLILVVVYACISPAIYGISLIREMLETRYAVIPSESPPAAYAEFIALHTRLREQSQRYLAAIGLIVTLVTLTTGANRDVGIALMLNPNRLPTTVVLTYGLYFTVVVALIYAPTFLSLVRSGMDLRDRLYPICQVDTLAETMAKRKSFEDNMQLNIGLQQSLSTGLIILAPLLSGVLTAFLGKS